jgi:hypothetical protein
MRQKDITNEMEELYRAREPKEDESHQERQERC